MVLFSSALLGLLAVGGVIGLAGILVHIIEPLSILFAGAFSFQLLQFLEANYEYGFGELEDKILSLGLSVAAGFLVYKIIGFLVLSLGILTGLVLGLLLFVLGPATVIQYTVGFLELLGGDS